MTASYITFDQFEQGVLRSDRPTLVDFYADWCGPCRAMESIVEQLAVDVQGRAQVAKVNVDESPELAAQYGVQSIPTFLVVRDGEVTQRLVGVQSRQALAAAVAG